MEIKPDYLISIIGMKEVELSVCREQINTLVQTNQKLETEVKNLTTVKKSEDKNK